jgi:outer membrane receptor protein involved in Fe transport
MVSGESRAAATFLRARGLVIAAAAGAIFVVSGSVVRADPQPIEQVTVTSARLPEAVGSAAFSTVKLDKKQLEKSDRLDDALKQVPGLSLFRRTVSISSNVTTQGVSLRNIAPSGAGRALVLLDGVPLNDPFGGWIVWTALPYEDIGGAEVVRGAGAGPYGAGALTGTILLAERDQGDGMVDAQVGSLSSARVGASHGESIGDVDLFASASFERSNGWIPARPPTRGAADNHVWFDGGSASLRANTYFGGVLMSARASFYDEGRGAGLVGGSSSAHGATGSLTLAEGPSGDRLGWRLQGWVVRSSFANHSVSVAPDRTFTTPSNDQFETPALGLGFNAALLGQSGAFHWEAGADLRDDSGESRELFRFTGGTFTMTRRAGGRAIVGGLYGEGAIDTSQWLLTLGVRGDYWATSQGHLVETVRATGAITNDQDYAGRDGVVPTARAGIRRNFDDGEYLRVAGYAGFRAPTLNELYRPFRAGNVVTEANADLKPEKLYGAEAGWGGDRGALHWDATAFWNELHQAVANVTVGVNLQQRQNAGDVRAFGLEGQASYALSDTLNARAAISHTEAKFVSGQLDGLRPAQAPRTTITAGATWLPLESVQLDADLHWESMRFEDDQNKLRLGSAFVLDLRAAWRFADGWSAFVEADNATDAEVATAENSTITINGVTREVVSFGQPRVIWAGLRFEE